MNQEDVSIFLNYSSQLNFFYNIDITFLLHFSVFVDAWISWI